MGGRYGSGCRRTTDPTTGNGGWSGHIPKRDAARGGKHQPDLPRVTCTIDRDTGTVKFHTSDELKPEDFEPELRRLQERGWVS